MGFRMGFRTGFRNDAAGANPVATGRPPADRAPANRAPTDRPPAVRPQAPGPDADIRALATAAALRSLFYAMLPVPVTLAAITVSPLLPYAVGTLVSFALVAACVALAILYGCRVLRVVKPGATAAPADTGRRSAASIAASAAAGRALARRRGMGIVGIVLGGLHGLFLVGNLALSIPGMLWLASVRN